MAICMPSAGDLFPHIFNLINSNIGVGLLAMPYCFHECGILLTVIILLLMSVATYFSCVLILKTTHQLKCDSLERAAFKSHGVAGKRIVDLCVIGLLFGMLVGLNVAISDLGSEIFDTLYGGKASLTVRRSVLLFTIFIVLPFCCLRRVAFLSTSSFLAVFLYVTFLLNLLCNYAIPKMQSKQFTFGYFRLWRPQGLVHCVPIIASSVCCQVQVNSIYSSLRNPSVTNMKKILISAVTFIFSCYLFAGLLGYVAFYHGSGAAVAGDMLAMYPEDNRAFHIRVGFLYTVAASIPLILFPLRTALYSLLFEEDLYEEGPLTVQFPPTIPDVYFRCLTLGIIFLSMVASQTTDKVEVILTYTGGLAGGACCYLLPAAIGARALGVRKRSLEMGLMILLLCGLGVLILLSPFLTFLGVDV